MIDKYLQNKIIADDYGRMIINDSVLINLINKPNEEVIQLIPDVACGNSNCACF